MIDWYDLLDLGLEGRAWDDVEHPYDRLPARARATVTDRVWELARESAGMRCRFVTDGSSIHARWALRGWENMVAHIPQSGAIGLDLYARDTTDAWRWAGSAFNGMVGTGQFTNQLVGGIEGKREYMLYLPYRHNMGSCLIGVSAGASMMRAPQSTGKPICFYGTSIVHGASATRPGMTYPAIVSRRLDRPYFNLGFGGNGPMHLEVAQLMAELDVAMFTVAGCENMSAELVKERAEPFTAILREKHATTPIVFIGNLRYANGWLSPGKHRGELEKNLELTQAVERIRAAGDLNTHLVAGPLVGEDDEATADGVHPTDLGFSRMADTLTPALLDLLPG